MNSPTPQPAIVPCRDCRAEVSVSAVTCPHCGAPRPANHEWHGEGYEWRSQRTWMGTPLVHVAFGMGSDGRVRTARGIVAVGQRAVGVVSVGILAAGFVSIGVISIGAISFGVVSLAFGFACGVNAIAPIAFGVTAIGYAAGGVEAVGWKILFTTHSHLR